MSCNGACFFCKVYVEIIASRDPHTHTHTQITTRILFAQAFFSSLSSRLSISLSSPRVHFAIFLFLQRQLKRGAPSGNSLKRAHGIYVKYEYCALAESRFMGGDYPCCGLLRIAIIRGQTELSRACTRRESEGRKII